ncbi:MAG: DUF4255 domain-containing protein, partial [Chloroflexi bacterium]|nr:DUF4255 domain-containing protein [Chloroflexota bacterium]
MQLFHENPVLTRNAIRTALASPTPVSGGGGLPPTMQALQTAGLADQIEQIKIVPQAQSTEEISKLWTALQAKYRPSAAYLASVVLIESSTPARSPLPVLTIGANDAGVIAQPNLDPPFPTISEIVPPNQQIAVRLGETFTVNGFHLDGDVGDAVKLIFMHPRFAAPLEENPTTVSASEITFTVPNDVDNWPAGVYTLMVGYRQAGRLRRTTNQMPFALAPSNPAVTPNPAARDGDGNVTLTLTVSPKVWLGQRAALLLGSHEFAAQPFSVSKTDTLTFVARALDPDDYLVRLRVDGVESLLVLRSGALPVFDPAQAEVTIT